MNRNRARSLRTGSCGRDMPAPSAEPWSLGLLAPVGELSIAKDLLEHLSESVAARGSIRPHS
jgi:hypothetical protein